MDKTRIRKARVKFLRKLASIEKKRRDLMIEEELAYELFCCSLDDGGEPPTFFNAIRTWFAEKTIFPDVDPATQHLRD